MIAQKNRTADTEFVVIHPLFDVPEEKRTGLDLGTMRMSKTVRMLLMSLRAYLVAMGGLLAYHLLDLAGAFGNHIAH